MPDEAEEEVKAISALISALKPLDPQARVHVLDFVVKRLGISLTPDVSAVTPSSSALQTIAPPTIVSTAPPSATVDIRTFAREKNPKTVNEKIAVVAFYIAHLSPAQERRDYIIADDIKPYFIQAGLELPTSPGGVTLANAKNAGYLNALDRGQFRLNAVGHNLVAHKLPPGEAHETKARPSKNRVRSRATRKAKK
jgi:hypothetical protein